MDCLGSSIAGCPLATALCCLLAIVFALWNGIKLRAETRPIHDSLKQAIKAIKKVNGSLTSKDMVVLNKIFETDTIIGDVWREFDESLIYDRKGTAPDENVKNTRQANEFINGLSLLESRIISDWYNAVPGVLTAIGLTGTFVSIYFALGALNHIDFSNHNQLSRSLNDFIAGLSAKFISSIVGTVCAVGFLVFEKSNSGINGIYKECAVLQVELKRRLRFISNDTLLEELGKQINLTCTEVSSLKAGLPKCIEDGLSQSISAPVASLATQLDHLAALVEDQAKRREESINKLVLSVVQHFKQSLLDATDKEFAALAAVLTQTSGVVDGLNDKLIDSMKQQESLLNAQKAQNELILDATSAMQTRLLETLKNQCESLLVKQSAELTRALDAVSDSSTHLLKTNERIAEQTLGKVERHVEKVLQQVENGSANHLKSMGHTHEYMVSNLESWIGTASEEIQKLINQVSQESLQINSTMKAFAKDLVALESIAKAGADAQITVANNLNGLAGITKTVDLMTTSISRGQDKAEEMVLELADRYEQHQKLLDTQEHLLARYERLLRSPAFSMVASGRQIGAAKLDKRNDRIDVEKAVPAEKEQ